jgi:hypothetical protein
MYLQGVLYLVLRPTLQSFIASLTWTRDPCKCRQLRWGVCMTITYLSYCVTKLLLDKLMHKNGLKIYCIRAVLWTLHITGGICIPLVTWWKRWPNKTSLQSPIHLHGSDKGCDIMLTNHKSVHVWFLVQSGNAGFCSLRATFTPKAPKMMTQNLLSDNNVLKRTMPSRDGEDPHFVDLQCSIGSTQHSTIPSVWFRRPWN